MQWKNFEAMKLPGSHHVSVSPIGNEVPMFLSNDPSEPPVPWPKPSWFQVSWSKCISLSKIVPCGSKRLDMRSETGCEFTGSGWGLWFSTRKWMFTIGFWHGLTWYNDHNWLVVYLHIWKNMSSSVGMMKFPTEWKNKTCSKPPTSLIWPAGQTENAFNMSVWLYVCMALGRLNLLYTQHIVPHTYYPLTM